MRASGELRRAAMICWKSVSAGTRPSSLITLTCGRSRKARRRAQDPAPGQRFSNPPFVGGQLLALGGGPLRGLVHRVAVIADPCDPFAGFASLVVGDLDGDRGSLPRTEQLEAPPTSLLPSPSDSQARHAGDRQALDLKVEVGDGEQCVHRGALGLFGQLKGQTCGGRPYADDSVDSAVERAVTAFVGVRAVQLAEYGCLESDLLWVGCIGDPVRAVQLLSRLGMRLAGQLGADPRPDRAEGGCH